MTGATTRRFVYLQVATLFQCLHASRSPLTRGKMLRRALKASCTVKQSRRLRVIQPHTRRLKGKELKEPTGGDAADIRPVTTEPSAMLVNPA